MVYNTGTTSLSVEISTYNFKALEKNISADRAPASKESLGKHRKQTQVKGMISAWLNDLNPLRYTAAPPTANGFCDGGLNWRREAAGCVSQPRTILLTCLLSILSSCYPRRARPSCLSPLSSRSFCFSQFSVTPASTKVSPSAFPVNSV